MDKLEQGPFPGNALQLVSPALSELNAGADHQVVDGTGCVHPAVRRRHHDAGRDVESDAARLAIDKLDLAGVQPGPDLQA